MYLARRIVLRQFFPYGRKIEFYDGLGEGGIENKKLNPQVQIRWTIYLAWFPKLQKPPYKSVSGLDRWKQNIFRTATYKIADCTVPSGLLMIGLGYSNP